MNTLRDVVRSGSLLLTAALVVGCAGAPDRPQAMYAGLEATDLAAAWLRADCFVDGEYGEIVQAMQERKDDLGPIFERELLAGPPEDYRGEAVAAAEQLLTRFKAALASNETLGLDGAKRADADYDRFRAQAAQEVTDAYRERAALGMLVIELDSASARLRELAADKRSPLQKYALDALSTQKD